MKNSWDTRKIIKKTDNNKTDKKGVLRQIDSTSFHIVGKGKMGSFLSFRNNFNPVAVRIRDKINAHFFIFVADNALIFMKLM